jgi:DNA-binding HxlR family transcriptional regulator
MTIKPKYDVKELFDRVSTLSADDLIILKNLRGDNPKRTTELASELFILPRIIDESVNHLRERGFILETTSDFDNIDLSAYPISLTAEGEDAKSIIDLVEKTKNK